MKGGEVYLYGTTVHYSFYSGVRENLYGKNEKGLGPRKGCNVEGRGGLCLFETSSHGPVYGPRPETRVS